MKKYNVSLGCWSSGHRNLSMYQVSSSTMFFCQLHAHICPLYNVLFEVVVVFQEIHTLNMPMFVGSQSFISLPSFMFVSAAVSELRESNQNKEKNSEIDYFQFKTFPWHIIYPFLNQRYLLSTCTNLLC